MLKHLRSHHTQVDYQGGLVCKKDDCGKTFSTYESFRVHICRYHDSSMPTSSDCNDFPCNADPESLIYSDTGIPEFEDVCAETSLPLSKELGLFYLKMREFHVLPIKTAKNIMDDVIKLLSLLKEELKSAVQSTIDEHKISDFETMWYEMKRESCFREFCKRLNFVEPETIELSDDQRSVLGASGHAHRHQYTSYQYIPICKTLVCYLSHWDVLHSIERCKIQATDPNSDGVLSSYTDGELFRSNALFQGNFHYIRLNLYCDEIEVCNPIGTARTAHKLTCIYFTVANIEQKYQSNLRNIHLLAVIPSLLLKGHGYAKVLDRLEQDLITLENDGIVFDFDGTTFHFKGGIATVIADNLGSHDFGGFRRCFSSGRICRYCMCVHEEIFTKFHPTQFTPRSVPLHNHHVQSLQENCDASKDLISAYGVRCSYPFLKVKSFHPITSLPPDCQHDFLEGIIIQVMECIFEDLNRQKLLSKFQIVSRVKLFSVGISDRDNFPKYWNPFSNKSLTSTQAWCLFRCLPFLIADAVPEHDSSWEMYLALSNICDIVFAPSIKTEWVSYLDVQIQDFLERFASNSDFACKIRPKMHFMIHYPALIMKYGPIRPLWAMRFEAFHQKVKKVMKRCSSFKNVPVTVANRVQRGKCFEQAGLNCLSMPTEYSSFQTMSIVDLPKYLSDYFSDVESLTLVKSLKFDERLYRVGGVCVTDITSCDNPQFFQISAIVNHPKCLVFGW